MSLEEEPQPTDASEEIIIATSETNIPKPWDRLPGEPPRDYRVFLMYRNLGMSRSLRYLVMELNNLDPKNKKMTKPAKEVPKTMQRRSTKFRWVDRCAAWDDAQLQMEESHWNKRQNDLRRSQWEASELLFKLGTAALKNLQPADLTAKDIIRFLELASEIGKETKREPISTDFVRQFLNALPEALRERTMLLLKPPSNINAKEIPQ